MWNLRSYRYELPSQVRWLRHTNNNQRPSFVAALQLVCQFDKLQLCVSPASRWHIATSRNPPTLSCVLIHIHRSTVLMCIQATIVHHHNTPQILTDIPFSICPSDILVPMGTYSSTFGRTFPPTASEREDTYSSSSMHRLLYFICIVCKTFIFPFWTCALLSLL